MPTRQYFHHPAVIKRERTLSVGAHHDNMRSVQEAVPNNLDVSLVPESLLMPFSNHLKNGEELHKEEWVVKLHSYLLTLNKSVSPHVNMVFGDYKHRRLVLNWITAAVNVIHPPLHNVLVLSLDNLLCELLADKTMSVGCIAAVSENSLFNGESWIKHMRVRNIVLWMINYWGYDVASYDSDAVLLKNPQVLYDERPDIDLLSGSATFPYDVAEKWGFTLCSGTLLYKATLAIGI